MLTHANKHEGVKSCCNYLTRSYAQTETSFLVEKYNSIQNEGIKGKRKLNNYQQHGHTAQKF